MVLKAIEEAMEDGARFESACQMMGISPRTVERWKAQAGGADGRMGPKGVPRNKLTEKERKRVLEVANAPEYRDLSPKQIVPRLADQGEYIASESTYYRILHEQDQVKHREPSRPSNRHKPAEYAATGPNEIYTWDITYLRSAVTGMFFYLYMVVDIWSRKIVGWEIHDIESMELSSALIERICMESGIDPEGLVLHSDNGGPMKGSTMLATLQRLGIIPSFSRPHVSDDNPYSEALFRTLKYRPEYPRGAFDCLDQARRWVEGFVQWYNTCHLHSSIRFVTPEDRHSGREAEILKNRQHVYAAARARHPERWSGKTRNWDPVDVVRLNPKGDIAEILEEKVVA